MSHCEVRTVSQPRDQRATDLCAFQRPKHIFSGIDFGVSEFSDANHTRIRKSLDTENSQLNVRNVWCIIILVHSKSSPRLLILDVVCIHRSKDSNFVEKLETKTGVTSVIQFVEVP